MQQYNFSQAANVKSKKIIAKYPRKKMGIFRIAKRQMQIETGVISGISLRRVLASYP